jgi:hypothetical protein
MMPATQKQLDFINSLADQLTQRARLDLDNYRAAVRLNARRDIEDLAEGAFKSAAMAAIASRVSMPASIDEASRLIDALKSRYLQGFAAHPPAQSIYSAWLAEIGTPRSIAQIREWLDKQ